MSAGGSTEDALTSAGYRKKTSRSAGRSAAKQSADNLIQRQRQEIGQLQHENQMLRNSLGDSRLLSIAATLPFVDAEVRLPHEVQLRRNIATHVSKSKYGHKDFSELNGRELRLLQKGRALCTPYQHVRTEGDFSDDACSSTSGAGRTTLVLDQLLPRSLATGCEVSNLALDDSDDEPFEVPLGYRPPLHVEEFNSLGSHGNGGIVDGKIQGIFARKVSASSGVSTESGPTLHEYEHDAFGGFHGNSVLHEKELEGSSIFLSMGAGNNLHDKHDEAALACASAVAEAVFADKLEENSFIYDMHDKFNNGEDVTVFHDERRDVSDTKELHEHAGAALVCASAVAEAGFTDKLEEYSFSEDMHEKFSNGKDATAFEGGRRDVSDKIVGAPSSVELRWADVDDSGAESDAEHLSTADDAELHEKSKEVSDEELVENQKDSDTARFGGFEGLKVKPGVCEHMQIEFMVAAPWRRRRNTCQRFDLAALDSRDNSPSLLVEPPGIFDFTTKRGFGVKKLLDEKKMHEYLHDGSDNTFHYMADSQETDILHGNPLHGGNLHGGDDAPENGDLHVDKHDNLHDDTLHGDFKRYLRVPADKALAEDSVHLHDELHEDVFVHGEADNLQDNGSLHQPAAGDQMHVHDKENGFVIRMASTRDGVWVECIAVDTLRALVHNVLQHVYLVGEAIANWKISQATSTGWRHHCHRTREIVSRRNTRIDQLRESLRVRSDFLDIWRRRALTAEQKNIELSQKIDAAEDKVANLTVVNSKLIDKMRSTSYLEKQIALPIQELKHNDEIEANGNEQYYTDLLSSLAATGFEAAWTAEAAEASLEHDSTNLEHDAQHPGKIIENTPSPLGPTSKTRRGRKKNKDGNGKKKENSCAESPSGAHNRGSTDSTSSALHTHSGPLGSPFETEMCEPSKVQHSTHDQLNLQHEGNSIFTFAPIHDWHLACQRIAFGFTDNL